MRGFDSLALEFVQIFNMTLISKLAETGKIEVGAKHCNMFPDYGAYFLPTGAPNS